jgi:hypothetical protein
MVFFFCRGQTNLDGYRANQPSQLVSDAMSTATRTPYLRYHRCDKQPPNLANLTRPLQRVLPQPAKKIDLSYIFQQAKRKKTCCYNQISVSSR